VHFCTRGADTACGPRDGDERAGQHWPCSHGLLFADGLTKYCAPPLPVVPACVDEVVAPEAVIAFRGAMCLTHRDFLYRAKHK
jgi:hypothetical protein